MTLLHKLKNGDVVACNCSECGRMLLGAVHRKEYDACDREDKARLPPMVAGRINGRPMCPTCVKPTQQSSLAANLTPRQVAKLGKTTGG